MSSRLLALAALLVGVGGLVAVAVATAPGPTTDVAVDDIAAAVPDDTAPDDGPADDATATDAQADPGAEAQAAAAELENLGPRQDLEQIDGWLQADPSVDSLDDFDGKVTVVQFWTFGCINCKNTLPNLQALRDAFGDRDDFAIVGVHSPEFDHEEVPANISAAAEELDVTWPIALDTAKKSFFGWQGSTGYWPRTYVVDREGDIRFDHAGEGAYDRLNDTVATLLAAGE